MNKIFINAGHSIYDVGAVHGNRLENKQNIILRDAVLPRLQKYGEVLSVPDSRNLKSSIAWINNLAIKDDFAFSIHFNNNSDTRVRGTSAYFSSGNDREAELAGIFARNVSEKLQIPNRGAVVDTFSWVGSLGWLRKLKCDSVLLEVCYFSNPEDMSAYDIEKAAQGIDNALAEILGRQKELDSMKKLLSLLQRLLAQLLKLKALLVNK